MKLFFSIFLSLAFLWSPIDCSIEDIAYCDECFCIPAEGESCPTDRMPQIEFSEEMIENLITMQLENPMTLTCDPYKDDGCDTDPPLEDGGVCVAEIKKTSNSDECPSQGYSYRYVRVNS